MATIQNFIELVGLVDGTTLYVVKRVANAPLVQRYNKGTTQYVPDFEAMAENARPVALVIPRDVTTGDVLTPNAVTYKYNGIPLTFGTDGLSTNESMAGVFKKVADYPVAIGDKSYNLPGLRVMKNLVPLSGYDNDLITVSGTVEMSGQSVPFEDVSFPVTIQESTGSQYDVNIDDDKAFVLNSLDDTLTLTATVTKGGVPVTDLTGFTFQYVKVTATGDVKMGTSAKQVITTADVDSITRFRCDVSLNGTLIASGYAQVMDRTEAYRVEPKITGIEAKTIRKGQTATITPVAIKMTTGEEVPDAVQSWQFYTKDNAGADFILTGKDAAKFAGKSFQVTYSDIQRAKMGMTAYIQGTIA